MKCIIYSNSSNEREYDNVKTRSAMKCANIYGRCDGGEVVTVTTNAGKPVSRVVYSPTNGGEYIRVALDSDD